MGNLCSAACGKVVARNLEIAEAERRRKEEKLGAAERSGERNKKTRKEEKREARREGEGCRSERKRRVVGE